MRQTEIFRYGNLLKNFTKSLEKLSAAVQGSTKKTYGIYIADMAVNKGSIKKS